MTWLEDVREPQARHEATYIVDEFARRDIEIGGVASPEDGVAYMYAEGQFLAREQYLDHIQGVLGERARADIVKRVIGDIVLVRIGDPARSDDSEGKDTAPEGEAARPVVLSFLDEVDAALGPGIATPDHVLTVSQGTPHPCPASEPQEVYDPQPFPAVCPGNVGDGVRIYVADTGIVAETVTSANCPWLAGVTGDPDPSVEANGTILPYGAHGTFVGGVIRSMAPGAQIAVRCVFATAGSALESEFVPELHQGFQYGAEIFHVTVASPTRWNLPLIAFEAWLQDLRQHKGVVCIAPAGNNESRLPCWPAAFPEVISVGALGADWRSLAYFSDYGGWVDVYAPGQNLVNAFAFGSYTCQNAPYAGQVRTFSGMAAWSGTSFSTPIVTGLIAARMARRGESAREAAEALLAEARAKAIPGVGPVLLPGCDEDERRGCGCGCGDSCRCGCGPATRTGCGCVPVTRTGCGCPDR